MELTKLVNYLVYMSYSKEGLRHLAMWQTRKLVTRLTC